MEHSRTREFIGVIIKITAKRYPIDRIKYFTRYAFHWSIFASRFFPRNLTDRDSEGRVTDKINVLPCMRRIKINEVRQRTKKWKLKSLTWAFSNDAHLAIRLMMTLKFSIAAIIKCKCVVNHISFDKKATNEQRSFSLRTRSAAATFLCSRCS